MDRYQLQKYIKTRQQSNYKSIQLILADQNPIFLSDEAQRIQVLRIVADNLWLIEIKWYVVKLIIYIIPNYSS